MAVWKRPRDPHWKPWIEHPNSGRSQGEVNQPGSADDLPSAVDPTVSKEKKNQRERTKQRQHSKEVRPPRVHVPGVFGSRISLTASFPTKRCTLADRKPSLAGSKDEATLEKLTVRSTPTKRLSNIMGT